MISVAGISTQFGRVDTRLNQRQERTLTLSKIDKQELNCIPTNQLFEECYLQDSIPRSMRRVSFPPVNSLMIVRTFRSHFVELNQCASRALGQNEISL